MSEREQSEEFKERMQASKLKINGQVILGRANYQLRIEDSIRTLDKDVERLSRLGKTRIDALDDMERRLKRMRTQLKTAVVPTVTDRVAFDLYQSNKKEVENKFTVCKRCERKILTALLEVHDLACARLQVRAGPPGCAAPRRAIDVPHLSPPHTHAERRHQVPGPASRAQRGRGGAGADRRARYLPAAGAPLDAPGRPRWHRADRSHPGTRTSLPSRRRCVVAAGPRPGPPGEHAPLHIGHLIGAR